MLDAEARVLSRQIPLTTEISEESFLEHYSGRRKNRYKQAIDSLKTKALDPARESCISAFVKAEKMNPDAKKNPDPRMIQARNARYNTAIGRFLKPIEHHLYRLKSDQSGLPMVGKGHSQQDRGKILAKKFARFSEPVCVSIDASRFDQHVHHDVLKVEHGVYKRSNRDQYFATLLAQQLNNRCFTRGGLKYKAKGKRMSGDMNTALGNCVLMIIMILSCLKSLLISKFEVFDDGDDCLIIIEKKDLPTLMQSMPSTFLEFGQELKIENIAYSLEEVEWCQCKPVLDSDGSYQMCSNWRKILSQSASGVQHWDNHERQDMSFSVGQCIMAVHPNMPIISSYAKRLCSVGGSMHRDIVNTDWVFKVAPTGKFDNLGSLTPGQVTIETRSSFAKAFGIDEIEQLRIEEALEGWIPLDGGILDAGNVVSGNWEWNYPPGSHPADRDVVPTSSYLP